MNLTVISILPLFKEKLECLTWFCIGFLFLTWATPQAPLLTYFTLDIKCRNSLGFCPKSFSLLILDTLPWWSPLLRLQLLCVTVYADILSLNLFPDSYDKSTWWSCQPLKPGVSKIEWAIPWTLKQSTKVISTTIYPVCQARSLGNLLEFSVSLPSMSNQFPRPAVSSCQYLFNPFTYLRSLPHCPSWHHHSLYLEYWQSPVLLLSHPFSTLSSE